MQPSKLLIQTFIDRKVVSTMLSEKRLVTELWLVCSYILVYIFENIMCVYVSVHTHVPRQIGSGT